MTKTRLLLVALAIAAPSASLAQGTPTTLGSAQVNNLVLLGKVWGFAKYHHPAVTRGRHDWDAELLKVLPSVLAATDRTAATRTMARWLGAVDSVPPCAACAPQPNDIHLAADVAWIRDTRTVGPLGDILLRIYTNRTADTTQHYVSFMRGVGNPVFNNEKDYAAAPLTPELRLLSLYRFWNIIEYWFPYRDLIDEDWDAVLKEFVPKVWSAAARDDYRLQMLALIARVKDTHANLWNGLDVRPPTGTHALPVVVRFVENRALVWGLADSLGAATGLRTGDIITHIDGARVDSLVAAWSPYYAASNEPTRLRDIGRAMTRGAAGPVTLTVQRGRETLTLRPERIESGRINLRSVMLHDRRGETFQRLTDDVAYLKLSGAVRADAAKYIEQAQGAKVLVIDIRNYPREFMVFDLGGRLVETTTEFVRFTVGQPANPGAFSFTPPLPLSPRAPRFTGNVVILVDETSQSQAEYTSMAFRVARGAIVVGSTTAGADGNVSAIVLPGGLRTMISGIGVFYPDRRPTQRVGIVPDLVVRPTIEGIRQGRDEVLEAGVGRALGREFRLPPVVFP